MGGVSVAPTSEGIQNERKGIPGVAKREKREGLVPEGGVREENLFDALQKIEKIANLLGRHLRFEVKRDAGLVQVQVVDTSNGKIVRKIPPDEIVRMVERVHQVLGAIFDQEA
jgi:flagellar protein FlaG